MKHLVCPEQRPDGSAMIVRVGLAGGFRETFRKPTLTMESSSRLAEPAAASGAEPFSLACAPTVRGGRSAFSTGEKKTRFRNEYHR